MFDLAISEHGDAIFSGSGDLLGKSGTDLLEQRMIIRMRMHRGTWVYDDDKTLGSNLFQLIGMEPSKAAEVAPAFVREALRPMDEIIVDDVHVITDDKSIALVVFYRVRDITAEVSVDPATEQQLQITLPLLGGGV